MIRALLGGSFDPVHLGHTAMVRHLLASGLVETVHVVPAWLSPHKPKADASSRHRLAMVRLAFAELPQTIVDTREIESGRPCYSVDTLAALVAEYPDDAWMLVVGGDNLTTLHSWHQPQRLQSLATIVVMGRDGRELSREAIRKAGLDPEAVIGVPEFDEPVSSTAVRVMLAERGDGMPSRLSTGIPDLVAQYILAHDLYLPDRNGD